MDVSNNEALNYLNCSNNQLTSLNVRQNTALEDLFCDNNQLTGLDVRFNEALDYLDCSKNNLSSLNVSQNMVLTLLRCNDNQLTGLDVRQNTALDQLYCNHNRLTSLDVRQNVVLTTLRCNNNRLSNLEISPNTNLKDFHGENNHLALSLLYRLMKPRNVETNPLFVYLPQGDTKLLNTENNTLDLRGEMNIGETATHWTISKLDGSAVEKDVYTLSDVIFRFLKKGAYKLVLKNDAVTQFDKTDNNFTWILKVGPYSINVQAAPAEGGDVKGSGEFYPGDPVSITAQPKADYNFVNWVYTGTNQVFGTKAEMSFEASEDLDLTACFEKIPTYTISTFSNNMQWGSVSQGGHYKKGSTVIVTATSRIGYRFVKWVDTLNEQQTLSNSARYTFTASRDLALRAYFEEASYNITLNVNNADMGTVSGSGSYKHNADVTIEAAAKPGYRFVRWTEGNVMLTPLAKYTFRALQHRTITAVFEQIPIYDIELQANNETWGQVEGSGLYREDSTVELSATAQAGYHFVCWMNGDEVYSKMKNHTFPAKTDLVLTAMFEKTPDNAVRVDVRSNGFSMGDAAITGDGIYPPGTEVSITATAKVRYRFVNWKRVNGREKEYFASQADTTFIVTEDMELVAYFINMPPHTITVNAAPSEGGEVSGGGNQVDEGALVKISAKPKPGWRFVEWGYIDFDGTPEVFSLASDTTFKATQNLNLTAYFEEILYTITAQTEDADKGIVSGSGLYKENADVTIRAEGKEGYRFIEWKNGEETFSYEADYTFPATEDLTLTAYFAEAPLHIVKVSAQDSTQGSVRGGGTYKENAMVKINAIPKDGYRFVEWRYNNALFSTKADTTFKVVEDMELTAYFEFDTTIQYYTIVVRSNNANFGRVMLSSGVDSAVYRENTEVTIVASPLLKKYFFLNWMNGKKEFSTQAIYTFKATQDLTLTAYFDTEECDGVPYVVGRTIYLSEPMGFVRLFNATTGQLLYEGTDTAFPVGNRGVYVLRACYQTFKVLVW